jgi:3-aminobutyryl-CoA ammonia-lyase
MTEQLTTQLRVRLSTQDTHYESGLIPAATIMRLFADCSTELGNRLTGAIGYLAAYESANFHQPVHVGDYVEVTAHVLSQGNRSRRVSVVATRSVRRTVLDDGRVTGEVVDPPEVVADAVLVAVTPR